MNSELEGIQDGQNAASVLFGSLREQDASTTDDAYRLYWWVGFFGALGGFAAGCLGSPAIEAISKMTAETTKKVLDKAQH